MERHCISFSDYYAAIRSPVIVGRVFKPDIHKSVKMPDDSQYILVIPDANPRYLIYLENAIAVVSGQGGMLNHMAIVCRELGIPYIHLENITDIIKDGEQVELDFKPETIEAKSPTEWIKVLTVDPSPSENDQRWRLDITKHLPRFINKEYELVAEFQGNCLFVSQASLNRFLADLRNNVDILKANLENYDRMSDHGWFLVLMLGAIAVELDGKGLFPLLVELTGDRDLALSLVRSGYVHYLVVGPQLRWGPWVSEFQIPQVLKDRLEKSKYSTQEEIRSALQHVKEPYTVEQIAEVIRLLIQSYERKGT